MLRSETNQPESSNDFLFDVIDTICLPKRGKKRGKERLSKTISFKVRLYVRTTNPKELRQSIQRSDQTENDILDFAVIQDLEAFQRFQKQVSTQFEKLPSYNQELNAIQRREVQELLEDKQYVGLFFSTYYESYSLLCTNTTNNSAAIRDAMKADPFLEYLSRDQLSLGHQIKASLLNGPLEVECQQVTRSCFSFDLNVLVEQLLERVLSGKGGENLQRVCGCY